MVRELEVILLVGMELLMVGMVKQREIGSFLVVFLPCSFSFWFLACLMS